jgi:hypothetical protein
MAAGESCRSTGISSRNLIRRNKTSYVDSNIDTLVQLVEGPQSNLLILVEK